MKLSWATGKTTATPLVDGFRTADGKILGRPVALDVQADGSTLISDDQGDAVYRLKKWKR